MPLPIIILLQGAWDWVANETLIDAIPTLHALGYNLLCLEMPSDLCQQDILINFEDALRVNEARFAEISAHLEKKGIKDNLLALEYPELKTLINLQLSGLRSQETVSMIKALPSDRRKLQMIKAALQNQMRIQGIDFPAEKFGIDGLVNAPEIPETRLQQEKAQYFKQNLLAEQRKEKGIIFVVGREQYSNLVNTFAEGEYLEELLFLHPYASDKPCAESLLPGMISTNSNLLLIEMAIANAHDRANFSKQVQEELQGKLNTYVRVEPTSTSILLSVKSGLDFIPYLRPSGLVDCYYHIDSVDDNIDDLSLYLSQHGVEGNLTRFQSRKAYCVQSINTEVVATRIRKLESYQKSTEKQPGKESVILPESAAQRILSGSSRPLPPKFAEFAIDINRFEFRAKKKNKRIAPELNETSPKKINFP